MKVKPSKLYYLTNKLKIYLFASSRGQPQSFLFVDQQLCYSRQNKICLFVCEIDYLKAVNLRNVKLLCFSQIIIKDVECERGERFVDGIKVIDCVKPVF